MRIVGGRLRGHALAGPRTATVRPTSDRLRESLFNILRHTYDLPRAGTRALDLFAGTGALGLEALSRGADHALFVESGVEGRGIIRTNIEKLALTGSTRLLRRDATDLGSVGTIPPFDLVFCDPPYGTTLAAAALASAAKGGWMNPDALCVVEDRAGTEAEPPAGFELEQRRVTGGSQLLFLKWRPQD